jgi:chromosome segregation ATPase
MDIPQSLLIVTGGAFLTGWLVAKIGGYISRKVHAGRRDPRDDRIRSLIADVRVAQTVAEKAKAQIEQKGKELADAESTLKARQAVVEQQENIILQLRKDLKDSVLKTRELRAELSERATENVKSAVKLREVETELSVAQASTDLLATGVLDYTTTDDEDVPLFKARS